MAQWCVERFAGIDRWSLRFGTISQVTSGRAAAKHLRDLASLRRVRDRIDREYAQPLDVEALARGAAGCSSLGTFSSRFTELVGVPPAPTGARRRA